MPKDKYIFLIVNVCYSQFEFEICFFFCDIVLINTCLLLRMIGHEEEQRSKVGRRVPISGGRAPH